jgi:hypothetical protein
MSLLRTAIRELVALFVDDGDFALALGGVVALAVLLAAVGAPPAATGAMLFFGCLLALAWSVLGTRRK